MRFSGKRVAKNKYYSFEKVIKRKGNKVYVKWKGYNSSFNSWVDKKTLYKWMNMFQKQIFSEEE